MRITINQETIEKTYVFIRWVYPLKRFKQFNNILRFKILSNQYDLT